MRLTCLSLRCEWLDLSAQSWKSLKAAGICGRPCLTFYVHACHWMPLDVMDLPLGDTAGKAAGGVVAVEVALQVSELLR